MNLLRKGSIKHKLMIIGFLISGVACLLAGIMLIGQELIAARQSFREKLEVNAQIFGTSSTAALIFNDQQAAGESLSALKSVRSIVCAVLYSKSGAVFASYHRKESAEECRPHVIDPDVPHIGTDHADIFKAIRLDNEIVGSLYIKSDVRGIYIQILWYILTVFVVMVISLSFVFLILSRLQKIITKPLIDMADVMRTVSSKKDYSVRVAVQSADESGFLAEGFNEMLSQIQNRDTELELHRKHLQDLVDRRTEELARTNTELQQELGERRKAEEKLLHDAYHDVLTGLPNRALFTDRLSHAIALAKRHEYFFAILFMDIDNFKFVNDSLGHIIGDQLLVTLSRNLQACLRPEDTIARFGGDEFAILIEGIGSVVNAAQTAERIQDELTLPLRVGTHDMFVTMSIGIAFSMLKHEKPEEFLRDADTAMYQAKSQGKAKYIIFNLGMHARAVERLQLETDLRKAIELQEFVVYYQPILSLRNKLLVGFEALVRWQHPTRGLVCPGDFIPLAEETGLILFIDQIVLREACAQMHKWKTQFPGSALSFMNVNLSNLQLAQSDLFELVSRTLEETGLDPNGLLIEITESVVITNPESTAAMLKRLKALGVHLYIDDFGTGYSSLSYLHNLPIDGLKIDRSFIRKVGNNGEGMEIIKTILLLAKDMNVAVIAEGLETTNQVSQITSLHCEYGQGFLFSRAVESGEAEAFIGRPAETDGRPAAADGQPRTADPKRKT